MTIGQTIRKRQDCNIGNVQFTYVGYGKGQTYEVYYPHSESVYVSAFVAERMMADIVLKTPEIQKLTIFQFRDYYKKNIGE